MNMQDYQRKYKQPGLDELAKRVNCNPVYLRQIAAIPSRKPSVSLTKKLIQAEPELTLQDLRPDIYELALLAFKQGEPTGMETPHGTDSQNDTEGAVHSESIPEHSRAA